MLYTRKKGKSKYSRAGNVSVATILAIMLSICAVIGGCSAETKEYVVDNASVVSDAVTEYVEKRCGYLARKTGAEIVIKTVKDTAPSGIDLYSDRFFKEYEIGDAEKNNGILLLLSIEEKEYRITPGKGLSSIVTEQEIFSIMRDSIEPYFSNENYGDSVKGFTDAVYLKLCSYYGIDHNGYENDPTASEDKGNEQSSSLSKEQTNLIQRIFIIIVLLLISVIAAVFILKKLFYYSTLLEKERHSATNAPANRQQRVNTNIVNPNARSTVGRATRTPGSPASARNITSVPQQRMSQPPRQQSATRAKNTYPQNEQKRYQNSQSNQGERYRS